MSPPKNNDSCSQHQTTPTHGSAISTERDNPPSASCSTSQRNAQPESIQGRAAPSSQKLQSDSPAPQDGAAGPGESKMTMTRELAKFFREASPPPGNRMSRPDEETFDAEEPDSAPLPRKKGRLRSALLPLWHRLRLRRELKAKPGRVVLPDSAVAGTSDGGHRYVGISIPIEHDHLNLVADNPAADPAARDQLEGGGGSGSPGHQRKDPTPSEEGEQQPEQTDLQNPDIVSAPSRRHSITNETWADAEMPPLVRFPGRHSMCGSNPPRLYETVSPAGSGTLSSASSSAILSESLHSTGGGCGGDGGGGLSSDSDSDAYYTAQSSQGARHGSDSESQSQGGDRASTTTNSARVPLEEEEEAELAYSVGLSSLPSSSIYPPPSSGVGPRVSVRGTPKPPLARLYGGTLYEPHALSDIAASSPDPSPTSPTSLQSMPGSQGYPDDTTTTNGGPSTSLRAAVSAQSIRSRHPRRVSGLSNLRETTQSHVSVSTQTPDTPLPSPPVESPLRVQGSNGNETGNEDGNSITNGDNNNNETGNGNGYEEDHANEHTKHLMETLRNRCSHCEHHSCDSSHRGVTEDLVNRLGRLEDSHTEWLSRLIPIMEHMAQRTRQLEHQHGLLARRQEQQSPSPLSSNVSSARHHPALRQEEEHRAHGSRDSSTSRPSSHRNGSVHDSALNNNSGSSSSSGNADANSNGDINKKDKGKGKAPVLVLRPPRSSILEPSPGATTSSGIDNRQDGTDRNENENGSGRNGQMRDSGVAMNDDDVTLEEWLERHYIPGAESSQNAETAATAAATAQGLSALDSDILSGPDLSMLPPLNMSLADFEVGGREWLRHRGQGRGEGGSQGLVGEEEDDLDDSGLAKVETVMNDLLEGARTAA